jgi:hypothetical protein
MNSKLSYKLKRLEESRKKLLDKLSGVSHEKLEISPKPGKWSVAQIFYHLNRAEYLSITYIGKKMNDVNNLKRTGLKEILKIGILKFLFALPVIRFKAPVNVLGDVPADVNYKAIITEWDETRIKLYSFLETLPEDLLNKNVFKQPAAGRLNIYQMLDFMQAHFNRHARQIKKSIISLQK